MSSVKLRKLPDTMQVANVDSASGLTVEGIPAPGDGNKLLIWGHVGTVPSGSTMQPMDGDTAICGPLNTTGLQREIAAGNGSGQGVAVRGYPKYELTANKAFNLKLSTDGQCSFVIYYEIVAAGS